MRCSLIIEVILTCMAVRSLKLLGGATPPPPPARYGPDLSDILREHVGCFSASTVTPSEGASNSSWDAVSEALRDNTTVLEVLKEQMASPLLTTAPPVVLSGTDPPKHAPEGVLSDRQPTCVSNSDSTKPCTTAVS